MFQSIFQKLPNAACVVDRTSFTISHINDMFSECVAFQKEVVGLSFPKDILSKSGQIDFYDTVKNMSKENLQNVIADRVETRTCSEFYNEDGVPSRICDVVYYRWNFTEIDSNTLLICGNPVEQSHKTETELRKSELIEFFLDAPIGLHCVDAEGRLLWANQTMLNMLGYTADEYIGHMVWEFAPDQTVVDSGKAKLEGMVNNQFQLLKNFPYKLRAKNGEIVHVLVDTNICWNADGTFNHTRCYVRDDQEQLVKNAVLKERMDKYKAMSAEKDRFIRIVFHHIRTPLHALSTSLMSSSSSSSSAGSMSHHSNVSKGTDDIVSDLQHKLSHRCLSDFSAHELNDLRLQLDSCLGLVDDLAFATMFDSDNVLRPRPVKLNIRRELEKILKTVQHQQHTSGQTVTMDSVFNVQFESSVPKVIAVDRSVLRALHNLISNAVKYSPGGAAVSITIGFEPLSAGETSSLPFDTPAMNALTSSSVPLLTHTCSNVQLSPNSGVLKCVVRNNVEREMNLVHVHKCFQNYFIQQDSNPLSADTTTSLSTFNSSSSNDFWRDKSVDSSFTESPSKGLDKSNGKSKSHSQQLSDRLSARLCRQISESLTSIDGLGVGLYVSYNIIQSLGGLLECSASPTESSFWFSLEVDTVPDKSEQRTGSNPVSPSSRSMAPQCVDPSSLATPDELASYLNTDAVLESWSNVEQSEVGTRHVATDYDFGSPSTTHSQDDLVSPGSSNNQSRHSGSFQQIESKHQRILVVDDSPICRRVLEKSLQAQGYDTDTACNGQEACDKLEYEPCLYHAVLMDLRMPIMDGLTATRICKDRRHLVNVPIIIVTAELGEEVRMAAMTAKATHFIAKPAHIRELLETLQKYICAA